MFSRARQTAASPWPFWLLLAAWVCANTPQVAVFALVTWLAEARSFTHQEKLARDVASLLAGEERETPLAQEIERARERMPARPDPIPVEESIAKIVLALGPAGAMAFGEVPPMEARAAAWACPAALAREPGLRPPRLRVA